MAKPRPTFWQDIGYTGLAYIAGVLWRAYYLFLYHPAQKFLYSDMGSYVEMAQKYYSPGFRHTIADTVYPPGFPYVLGALFYFDRSGALAITFQFLLSCAIPLLTYLLAKSLYDKRVARIALLITSLYYPFIDYASYFLTENLYIFLLLASMLALAKTFSYRRDPRKKWILALVAGVLFGAAATVKSVSLAMAGIFVLCISIDAYLSRRDEDVAAVVAMLAGLSLALAPAAVRCTRLNEGKFCLIGNDWARNFLLGHVPNLNIVRFNDEKRGYFYEFGGPAAFQKGHTEILTLPFGVYENGKIAKYTWDRVRQEPLNALLLSIENIFDLFRTIPWPSSHTPQRRWANLFQQLYYLSILIPAIFTLVHERRKRSAAPLGFFPTSPSAILALPYLALFICVFITVGEPRHRLPLDSLAIILASRFYAERASRRASHRVNTERPTARKAPRVVRARAS